MSKTTVAVLLVVGAILGHCYVSDNSYNKGYDEGYSEASYVAEEQIEEAAQEWYNEGYNEGYDDGYDTVYDHEIFEKEFTEYWEVARAEGKEEGIAETITQWQQKLSDSNAAWEKKVSEAYEKGKKEGLSQGETTGYNNGYNKGYSKGETDGYNKGYNAGYAAAPKSTVSSSSNVKQPSYSTSSQSTTVYVTKTGSKYHRSGCSYLKSKIAISLSNARAQGYTACSRCY